MEIDAGLRLFDSHLLPEEKPVGNNIEIEEKWVYQVIDGKPPNSKEGLLYSHDIKKKLEDSGIEILRERTNRFKTTYYDTHDFIFRNNKLSFRCRDLKETEDSELGIKGKSRNFANLYVRDEDEVVYYGYFIPSKIEDKIKFNSKRANKFLDEHFYSVGRNLTELFSVFKTVVNRNSLEFKVNGIRYDISIDRYHIEKDGNCISEKYDEIEMEYLKEDGVHASYSDIRKGFDIINNILGFDSQGFTEKNPNYKKSLTAKGEIGYSHLDKSYQEN